MNRVKKFLSVFLAVVLIANHGNTIKEGEIMLSKADAANDTEIQVENGGIPDLNKNYDEDSMLCKKLEYDEKNNETKLSEGLEEELNKAGVFDSELEELDVKDIKKLENAENISVQIGYFYVNDATKTVQMMSDEQIETTIEKKIENGDIEYEEEQSVFDVCLSMIGMGNITAKAKTADDSSKSDSGAMKQTLICSQTKKGGKISVTYTATWLDEAYYRSKDVCGVTMKNADIVSDSWSCKHTATHVSYDYFGNKYTEKCSTKPSKHWIASGGSGIAYQVNLFGNRRLMIYASTYNQTKIDHYNNEKITISFDCKVEDQRIPACKFTSEYNHLHESVDVTPSVDFSTGGISVSVSVDSSNEYVPISNNAYVKFIHL